MNIKYELNEKNYKNLFLANINEKKEKRFILIFKTIGAIIIFLIPFIAIQNIKAIGLIFLPLSIVFYISLPKLFFRVKNKNIFKWSLYPGFREEFIEKCSLSVSNKGIIFFNNWITSKFDWNKLNNIDIMDEFIILNFTAEQLAVPFTAFKDEKHKNDFLDILNMYKVLIGGNND